MAIELAAAYVSIIPSAKGIKSNLARELSPLDAEGTNVGDRTARNFGRTFVAGVATAATRGAVALGAGFTLAAGFGIKVAADFEQTQIAFEGILGSADAATAMLGDLREFANKTPFEFPNLTKSSKQLLAVGFAAEDIIPTMGTLGDTAATLGAGTGEIESVVRAIGQIKGKGKAASQELIQISEALPGFSAIGAIAEGLGVSVGEAFKLVEQGAVPADQAIGLILEGMEKFPGSAGAMERQSKTLNGVISTFKDTLSTTAIDFITPYLPAISAGVAAFGSFIQDTAVPAIQGFIDGISGLFDLFKAEGIGGVFERLGQLISENAPILGEKLLALGQKLVDWIGPQVGPALTALGHWLGDIVAWILDPGVGLLLEGVRELIPPLTDWIVDDALPTAVKLLGDFLEGFADWAIEDGIPAMIEAGKELGKALGEAILDGVKNSVAGIFTGGDIDAEIEARFDERAAGGPVTGGRPYIVGEEGPELFVPRRSGVILPNGATLPVSVPAGGGSGPLIGSLSIVGELGEDPVDRAFREARRASMLVGS